MIAVEDLDKGCDAGKTFFEELYMDRETCERIFGCPIQKKLEAGTYEDKKLRHKKRNFEFFAIPQIRAVYYG